MERQEDRWRDRRKDRETGRQRRDRGMKMNWRIEKIGRKMERQEDRWRDRRTTEEGSGWEKEKKSNRREIKKDMEICSCIYVQ
jgi:hypothetical protein